MVLGKTQALRHQDRKHNVLLVLEMFISRVNNNNKLVYGCEFHCLPRWGFHLLPSEPARFLVWRGRPGSWEAGGGGPQGAVLSAGFPPGCGETGSLPRWDLGQAGVSRSFWALTCPWRRCLFPIKEGNDVSAQATYLGEMRILKIPYLHAGLGPGWSNEGPREPAFSRCCLLGSGKHLLKFCVLGSSQSWQGPPAPSTDSTRSLLGFSPSLRKSDQSSPDLTEATLDAQPSPLLKSPGYTGWRQAVRYGSSGLGAEVSLLLTGSRGRSPREGRCGRELS